MSASSAAAASAKVQAQRRSIVAALVGLYDNTVAGELEPSDPKAIASQSAKYPPSEPEEFFDKNITFRDPLMKVTGIQHYRAQFASLHAIFPKISMQVFSVTWGEGSGQLTSDDDNVPVPHSLPGGAGGGGGSSSSSVSPDSDLVVIDALCTYELNKWIRIPIRQITSARISKEGGGGEKGKIIAHEDLWSLSDLLANVPLVGPCYRWLQVRAGAMVSSYILRRFSVQAGTHATMRDDNLNTNTLHAVYHPIEAERIGKKPLHQLTAESGSSGGGKKGKGGKEIGEAKEL